MKRTNLLSENLGSQNQHGSGCVYFAKIENCYGLPVKSTRLRDLRYGPRVGSALTDLHVIRIKAKFMPQFTTLAQPAACAGRRVA